MAISTLRFSGMSAVLKVQRPWEGCKVCARRG